MGTDEPEELRIRRAICADPANQAAQLRKALLGDDWLDDATAPADPWRVSTERFNPLDHRDAFIGNGWLGQRVNPQGDGSYSHGSRSFCYGVREADGRPGGAIRQLPLWATLRCGELIDRLFRPCEERTDYSQHLDLRSASVHTTSQRTTPGAQWQERNTIWLARHDPHLAVLEAEITPTWNEWLAVEETIDASDCADCGATQIGGDEDGTLVMRGEFGDHVIAIASRLVVEGGDLTTTVERHDRGWTRHLGGTVPVGSSCRVVKVVAVVTSDQADDPVAQALTTVERACADLDAERAAHEAAWAELWSRRIETDHPRLQQLINLACFQLYSSIRGGAPCSIPPCGLSGHGWRGMIFWDADTWMFPPLNLLQPELAQSMADYRLATADGARANAAADGYQGASYGWNSAEDGRECSTHPDFSQERHVTNCVALGLWQRYLANGDQSYLKRAWPVLRDCARYWASRVVHNQEAGRYEIRDVCCADEYAHMRDNNAYTNASTAEVLRLAIRAAEILGELPDENWSTIADGLWLVWDEARGIHLEYEGFSDDTIIKQADATLMIYPWGAVDDPGVMRRMRDFYRERYSEYLIMMAEAIDGIISCRLGDGEEAWEILRGLLPFFRQPFFGASESPWNEVMNFHTGLGGFLQVILNGFAGIRYHHGELVVAPALPKALGSLRVIGLQHGGRDQDLQISADDWSLTPMPDTC